MPIINGTFVKDQFGPHSISSAYDGPASFYHRKSGVFWSTMGIPCDEMEKVQVMLLNQRAEREAMLSGRPPMIIKEN